MKQEQKLLDVDMSKDNTTTYNLVKCFLDEVRSTGTLCLGMFNIHLYNNFIEVSLAEEHDLGAWVQTSKHYGAMFSEELHTVKDIGAFLEVVVQYVWEYEND